ncbi:hypothetical protein EVAR_30591_1 [Eumeta japonica]|uniref:Uncharacterized protein n=1 Tax=Eumeta variegata TaxID=151549 RepID=A0A4C1W8Z6_EUMVA|nr:hypothetical protein EVAR_30591_1 [Eumeta japonica]
MFVAAASSNPIEHSASYDAKAKWFVKNDVITRNLKVEPLEDFTKMLKRHTFNCADVGLTPHYITWHHNASNRQEAINSHETCCPSLPTKIRCELTNTLGRR